LVDEIGRNNVIRIKLRQIEKCRLS